MKLRLRSWVVVRDQYYSHSHIPTRAVEHCTAYNQQGQGQQIEQKNGLEINITNNQLEQILSWLVFGDGARVKMMKSGFVIEIMLSAVAGRMDGGVDKYSTSFW